MSSNQYTLSVFCFRERFNELVHKENDISNFINSFESLKAARLKEQKEKEETIVSVLDRVSRLETLTAHSNGSSQMEVMIPYSSTGH